MAAIIYGENLPHWSEPQPAPIPDVGSEQIGGLAAVGVGVAVIAIFALILGRRR